MSHLDRMNPWHNDLVRQSVPLKCQGKTEGIAPAVVHLAFDESTCTAGPALVFDGGVAAHLMLLCIQGYSTRTSCDAEETGSALFRTAAWLVSRCW